MTAEMKLSKIIINNIGEYNGEINLTNDCTLVNCVYLSSKEINDLARILKFMFLHDENNKITDLIAKNDSSDRPYVEIHISLNKSSEENGEICILRKSYINDLIIYEINSVETTLNDFINKQRELGCLLPFTAYLTHNAIYSLMNLTENDRVKLIEEICGNKELKTIYNRYKIKMEDLEIEMKFLNEHKKDFHLEKKLEIVRIENSKRIREAVNLYEKQFDKLALVKLFNYDKIFKATPLKLQKINEQLNLLKIDDPNILELKKSLRDHIVLNKGIFEFNIDRSTINDDIINYKKSFLNNEYELQSIAQHKIYDDVVKLEHEKIEKQIAEASKKLNDLENCYKKYNKTIREYNNLDEQFIAQHEDYLMLKFARSRIQQIRKITSELKSHKMQRDYLNSEQIIYTAYVNRLNETETKIQDELNEITAKLKNLQKEYKKIQNFIYDSNRWINKELFHEPYSYDDFKSIEQKLHEKFPRKIIGLLSELFEVKNIDGITVKKSDVLSLLGNYSNSIVLENSTILEDIRNYLRTLQCNKLNNLLIPQDFYLAQEHIKKLKSKVLPNIKLVPISYFLSPVSEEVKNILANILGSTVVCECESIEAAEKVYELLDKNVKVVSFRMGFSFKPESSHFHQFKEEDFSDMMETINKVNESRKKLLTLQTTKELENTKYKKILEHTSHLKIMKSWINDSLHRIQKSLEVLDIKIQKSEKIEAEKQSKSFKIIQNTCEVLTNKFQSLLDIHFQKFCGKHKLKSIVDYEIILCEFTSYQSRHKSLTESILTLTKAKECLENLLPKYMDWSERQRVIADNNQVIQKKIQELTEKLENAHLESNEISIKWKEILLELKENRNTYKKVKNEFKKLLLSYYTEFFEAKTIHLQTFDLLQNALLDYEKISLSKGSLLSILSVPVIDNNEEDFDFIRHQIREINPNFDILEDEIKMSPEIEEKIFEMERTFNHLKTNLDNYPLDLGTQENDLVLINEKIKELSIDIKEKNNECQKVLSQLKSVIVERKKRFEECLHAINEEIDKFCRVISNGRAYAELMPMNENEPYLEGIQYLWQFGPRTEYINENKKNWEAALAFFLGILSYKGQKILPYFELSCEMPIANTLKKYSLSNKTNLQSIVFWKVGVDENECQNCLMNFNDKILFIDNNNLQQKLICKDIIL